MTVRERALNYTLAMPPSLAGQGGHSAAFSVASALVNGFALDENAALEVLRQWNAQRAQPMWREGELKHKVVSALAAAHRQPRGHLLRTGRGPEAAQAAPGSEVAPKPQPPPAGKLAAYSPAKLAAFAAGCPREITPAWLRERSPTALPPEKDLAGTQKAFLDAVFRPAEHALIFANMFSQGDFLWTPGAGGERLGDRPGVAGVPSALPTRGRQGLWLLSNPIDGQWHPAPGGRWSRRSEPSITAWRHLLLESDEAPVGQWLKLLVLLPAPVVAVFSSGGRSIHALVRVDAAGKAEFDAMRDILRAVCAPLGADPLAMSGVRLCRLPGSLRMGGVDARGEYQKHPEPRLQRLLWLHPEAREGEAIYDIFK